MMASKERTDGCSYTSEEVARLITISIPTYRRPTVLAHALQSCFAQDYRPLEIDVSDDSPNRDSESNLCALSIPEGITLRYHRNSPALGQAENVKRLFSQARGKRLVLLHDDDVLLPGAIAALDAAWRSEEQTVMAFGKQEIILENGEVSDVETERLNRDYRRSAQYAGVQRDLLVAALWRQIPNDGFLVDSELARTVGYRSFAEVGDGCDADFGIRLAIQARGKAFVIVDRFTSQYRLSVVGLSQSHHASWKLFDAVKAVEVRTAAEVRARDLLLEQLAPQAVFQNALHGRRKRALRIMCSRFYRAQSPAKTAYRLGVIAIPSISAVRKLI